MVAALQRDGGDATTICRSSPARRGFIGRSWTLQGYPTLAAAAAMPVPIAFKPARGSRDGYDRLARAGAAAASRSGPKASPVHELLPIRRRARASPVCPSRRLAICFSISKARASRATAGAEYLFGVCGEWGWCAGAWAQVTTCARWAFTDAEERAAFEATIDAIMQAWDADPGMHVYHFGHYEPSAFKRLMGRYATRGDELDRLLRGERFVDLHAVVRQALRAGVESYSIKQLEPFYGFARDVDLREAAPQRQASSSRSRLARVRRFRDRRPSVGRALQPRRLPLGGRRCATGWSNCGPTPWLADRHRPAGGEERRRPATRSAISKRGSRRRASAVHEVPAEASTPDHPQHPHWLLAYLSTGIAARTRPSGGSSSG